MKLDDPKLTAFALGELSPVERVEIEAFLRTDAGASAEVSETLEIARILRGGLQAEEAAPLAAHQRDAIFRAASLAGLEQRPLEAALRPAAATVLTHAGWWNRPGPWQTIAACAVIGFGIYALSFPPPTTTGNGRLTDRNSGFLTTGEIGVPPAEGSRDPLAGNEAGPERPNDSGAAPKVLVGSAKAVEPVVFAQPLPPETKVVIPEANLNQIVGAPKPAVEENGIAARPNKPKQPVPVGSAPDKAVSSRWGAANEGERFLQERIAEAKAVRVGSNGAAFLQIFRPVDGVAKRYEMREYPSIRVNATFVDSAGQPSEVPQAEDTLTAISKPFLEGGK